jgi:subtilisin family serine protease
MSLGDDQSDGGDDSSEESDAIRYALAHNVVVVAAAGNGATEGNAVSYPGGERGVITVAAVDSNSVPASFSTTGWDVAVAAPGVNLPCDAYDSDDSYMEGSGTSQATAYVSGLVALIKSENPVLSPEQIRTVLEQTASHKPAGGRDDEIGFGVIDPVAALQAAKTMSGLPTVPKAGAGVPSGYFGYGPSEKVTLAAPGLSSRSRAEIGGAALLVIAIAVGLVLLLRRPRPVTPELVVFEYGEPGFPPTPMQPVQQPEQPQQPQLPPLPDNPEPGLGSDE